MASMIFQTNLSPKSPLKSAAQGLKLNPMKLITWPEEELQLHAEGHHLLHLEPRRFIGPIGVKTIQITITVLTN